MSQCLLSQSLQAAISAEAGSGLVFLAGEIFPGRLPGGVTIAYGSGWSGGPAQVWP